jgi:hypothetical protein
MQKAAMAVGVVFVLVGIAGFIPGITTNLGDLEFAGPDSGAELLGIFQVSVLHNVVHLIFGALGIYAASSFSASRLYLIGGGLVYALLVVYGAIVDKASDANFVPLNSADDWLHVVLAAGMIALGLILGREIAPRDSSGRASVGRR